MNSQNLLAKKSKNIRQKEAIIIDLDGIIFDNSLRLMQSFNSLLLDIYSSHKIVIPLISVKEIKKEYGFSHLIEPRKSKIKKVYNKVDDFVQLLLNYFLSNKYITLDRPYKDSFIFVKYLYKKGYTIIYFTGRHDMPNDSMRAGTEYMLRVNHFPFSKELLIMKPDKKIEDEEYKSTKIKEIISKYKIKAIIDDLPRVCEFYKKLDYLKNVDIFGITTTHKREIFKKVLPEDHIFPNLLNLLISKFF